MLVAVHLGQSGQPSPDELSRTPAPVITIPADATTPASAIRRIETGDGASTGSAQRHARSRAPGLCCVAKWPGTDSTVRVCRTRPGPASPEGP
jgi:hypothetical protein